MAEPYFAVTMFDDLLDRKGLVLVRGDFSWQLNKMVRRWLRRVASPFRVPSAPCARLATCTGV
jgi:hypothetical protein